MTFSGGSVENEELFETLDCTLVSRLQLIGLLLSAICHEKVAVEISGGEAVVVFTASSLFRTGVESFEMFG